MTEQRHHDQEHSKGGSTTRDAAGLRQELEQARVELSELLTEQGRLPESIRQAEQEDHAERLRAARSGGSIAATLSKMKSKVRGVKDRREELPYEIWSARIRAAELEREHYEAIAPELEERRQKAQEELHKATDELKEMEARHRKLTDVASAALREQTAAYQRDQEVERELARLEANGPESAA